MRLVAVSIVKNEADVIEAFIRHTSTWVDHHLVFDHSSTDGTREILHALQREGLRLSLYTDKALANLQQTRSNHLTRLAAQSFAADWILPLDADEILVGPDRTALEACLNKTGSDHPLSLRLLNYYPTDEDDSSEGNPVHRLRYSQSALSHTKKIFIPKPLALDSDVIAGKGSHGLYRNTDLLPDSPLPEGFHLAHLALRSPQHQVLRVVLAELQKLSNGSASEGLDTHYRLGYQLLAEKPEMFFATLSPPAHQLHLRPLAYRGDPLKYSQQSSGWNRLPQALLPFLEHLAISHGKLLDGEKNSSESESPICEISPSDAPLPGTTDTTIRFDGFSPISGWGETEGPVPEAFLPTFHWGHFPHSQLQIEIAPDQTAKLHIEALTYVENQSIKVLTNELEIGSLVFTRINQKETLSIPIPLQTAPQSLTLKYSNSLVTDYDTRQLAVLFLSLRISHSNA